MNRIIENTGGMPLKIDDLSFIRDASKEAIAGILAALPDCILEGCEATIGATVDVAAGYIWLQGEVYRVAAHSLPYSALNTYYWVVEATQSSPRQFADGNVHDVHEERLAVVVSTSGTPPIGYMPMQADYYLDLIQGKWKPYTPASWIVAPGCTFTPSDVQIRYKIAGKTLTIHFHIEGSVAGANTDSIGFVLPEGKSAAAGFVAQNPAIVQDNGSFNPGRIFINSSPVAAANQLVVWSENQFVTALPSADLIGQIVIEIA